MKIFTDYKEYNLTSEERFTGYLFSEKVSEFIPFYNHLLFLSEQSFIESRAMDFLQNTLKKQIRLTAGYEQYLLKKSSRPVYDLYACFQPFNESLKALYPFFSLLKKNLKKGDIVLNLWDRSGWISNLLCGMFPEQQVVSTWEGNKDVLGYSGYHYWFRDHRNFRVLFTEDYSHLPFADHSVAAVIGYDFFHRTNQVKLLKELSRVTHERSILIFPHIHLSNSEPEPFFERGCQQYHGTEYRKAFWVGDTQSGRATHIFSEPELFLFNDLRRNPPVSDPGTEDYNALIINLPADMEPDPTPFSPEDIADSAYIVVNPLIRIDYWFQRTRLDLSAFGGNLEKLLDRHPVYLERIKDAIDLNLDESTVKWLFLASQAYPVIEIRKHLGLTGPVFNHYLEKYRALGLIEVVPVNESGMRLQNFLMTQNYLFPKKEQTIAGLWLRACAFFPERTFLTDAEDQSTYTYENTRDIVELICFTLVKQGVKKGDTVLIYGKQNPEAVFLFLACALLGVVTVPLNEGLSDGAVSAIVAATAPRLCFLSPRQMEEQGGLFSKEEVVLFDEEGGSGKHRVFSEWVEEEGGMPEYPPVTPEDPCVILFTSGSTGLPKGIPLSHGRLFRSGELVSKQFDWSEDDRFVSKGNLGSMSGLRNPVVVPLFKGSATVIISDDARQNLFAFGEVIQRNAVSILGANPALLSQLIKHKERLKDLPLKKVLCTGNNLTGALKQAFKDTFNLQVINYYGLTETAGICIAEVAEEYNFEDDYLGYPVSCIAQVVDENDRPNEIGELRIFSENICDHYLGGDTPLKKGWLYTGDKAEIRADGSVRLIGRNTDIFKTKDERIIYLSAVENALKNNPQIKDACIVQKKNEEPVIFIVGDKPLEKGVIRAVLKEVFNLAFSDEHIIFRDEFPYNSQGKINKDLL